MSLQRCYRLLVPSSEQRLEALPEWRSEPPLDKRRQARFLKHGDKRRLARWHGSGKRPDDGLSQQIVGPQQARQRTPFKQRLFSKIRAFSAHWCRWCSDNGLAVQLDRHNPLHFSGRRVLRYDAPLRKSMTLRSPKRPLSTTQPNRERTDPELPTTTNEMEQTMTSLYPDEDLGLGEEFAGIEDDIDFESLEFDDLGDDLDDPGVWPEDELDLEDDYFDSEEEFGFGGDILDAEVLDVYPGELAERSWRYQQRRAALLRARRRRALIARRRRLAAMRRRRYQTRRPSAPYRSPSRVRPSRPNPRVTHAVRENRRIATQANLESRVQGDVQRQELAKQKKRIDGNQRAIAASAALAEVQRSFPDLFEDDYLKAALPLASLLFLSPDSDKKGTEGLLTDPRFMAAAAAFVAVVVKGRQDDKNKQDESDSAEKQKTEEKLKEDMEAAAKAAKEQRLISAPSVVTLENGVANADAQLVDGNGEEIKGSELLFRPLSNVLKVTAEGTVTVVNNKTVPPEGAKVAVFSKDLRLPPTEVLVLP